jgi:predicted dehydrogenase
MDLSRRELLAATGAAAGAAAFGNFGQEKPVGWAILGLGGYATRNIMPNFKHCKHSRLVSLITGSPEKGKMYGAQYGIPENKIYDYKNLEKIANDPDIDVVYVITPPGTHHEFVMRALKAGKHVSCEKPMTGDLKQAIEMVEEANKRNKRLGVGYRCHFEPHNLEAQRLCKEGKLGTIRYIRSDHGFTLGDWSQWHHKRAIGGYGAISEIGIYAIQAMCMFAGADPIEVVGTRDKSSNKLFKEVEDSNHFTLVFPNGITGQGATSYSWNANNVRIYGNAGRIDAEPATGYENHQFTLNGQPMIPKEANQWVLQMDHLSQCIRDPKMTLKTGGDMGLRDVRIMDAILRSADAGGKPIRL